jgi:hypothetical protein
MKTRKNRLKFRIWAPAFTDTCGGCMVLYKLAKDLSTIGQLVTIYDKDNKQIKNKIFSSYNQSDITNEIVIYPEIVKDNPLHAKRVVRWILCALGKNTPKDIYKTWGKYDSIYYFSSFQSTSEVIKPLYTFSLHGFENKHLDRKGSCFTIRKAKKFHKKITYIHPPDSIEITNESNEELFYLFNQYEYFYCYDPYSYLAIIAALCGCIPIVIPIKGLTKYEWLKTLYVEPYLKVNHLHNLNGIAYGIEDISFAKKTLPLVKKEQHAIELHGIETVKQFVKDMKRI